MSELCSRYNEHKRKTSDAEGGICFSCAISERAACAAGDKARKRGLVSGREHERKTSDAEGGICFSRAISEQFREGIRGMGDHGMGLAMALFMEAFVSIHMSVFVLLPLSKMISRENSKKIFWILFWIRIAILLCFDFFITTGIAVVDFFAVFVGAFIVTPISIKKGIRITKGSERSGAQSDAQTSVQSVAQSDAQTGVQSGVQFDAQSDTQSEKTIFASAEQSSEKKAVHAADFDPLFAMPEEKCVEAFIKREMQRAQIAEEQDLIPEDMLRRKNILNLIFAVLLFVYVSLFFFHFPMITYVLGFLILAVYAFCTGRYQLMRYLKKEIKSRPQEKISNIVLNVKAALVQDYSKKLKWILMAVAVAGSLLLFSKPRIFYEQSQEGYYVRFYTYGLTNMTTATIPAAYQGEKVVGLRGNTFSNMPFLREVILPDTITEIRGQAFKNCGSLESVRLPEHLTYLGGEAFYHCTSLEEVNLPDGLTEIKGSTFEECSSLQCIEIPDNVTRIGGHAFYGNISLEEVVISPDSKLQEIGSSAFRCCDSLREITLPRSTFVNGRAFKETPVRINYYEY